MIVLPLAKEYIISQDFYVDENLQAWYNKCSYSVTVKLIDRANDVTIYNSKPSKASKVYLILKI